MPWQFEDNILKPQRDRFGPNLKPQWIFEDIPEAVPAEKPPMPEFSFKRLGTQALRSAGQGIADISRSLRMFEEYEDPAVIAASPQIQKLMERRGIEVFPPELKEADLQTKTEYLQRKKDELIAARKKFEAKFPETLPGTSGMIESAVTGVSRFAPTMLTTAFLPPVGLGQTFMQIAGGKYDEFQKQGVPNETAFQAALLSSAFQTPIEFAGNVLEIGFLKGLASRLGAKVSNAVLRKIGNVASTVLKNAVTEGLEEYLQQYPDEFSNIYAANPNASGDEIWQEFKRRLPEIQSSAVEASKIGAIGGGLITGVGGVIASPISLNSYLINKKSQAPQQTTEQVLREGVESGELPVEHLSAVREQLSPDSEQAKAIDKIIAEYKGKTTEKSEAEEFDREFQRRAVQKRETEKGERQERRRKGRIAEAQELAEEHPELFKNLQHAQEILAIVSPEYVEKIKPKAPEKGIEHAESIRKETEVPGPEERAEGQEGERIRIRDTEAHGLEAEQGKVAPKEEAPLKPKPEVSATGEKEEAPTAGEEKGKQPPKIDKKEFEDIKNYHLEQIDRWRSGEKATPGLPATSERYARDMREQIKYHEKILKKLNEQYPNLAGKQREVPAKVDLVETYKKINFKEADGSWDRSAIRNYANTFIKSLQNSLKKGWKTQKQLTVGPYKRTQSNPSKDLKQLMKAGTVQIAWDKEGMPYYAKSGEKRPDNLYTEEQIDAIVAEQERKKKPKRKPRRRVAPGEIGSGVRTLRGAIKAIGGINPLNFKGEVRNLPLPARRLFKKAGMPIDTAIEVLTDDKWLNPEDDIWDVLRETNNLKRDRVTADLTAKKEHELSPQERQFRKELEHEEEAPPEVEIEIVIDSPQLTQTIVNAAKNAPKPITEFAYNLGVKGLFEDKIEKAISDAKNQVESEIKDATEPQAKMDLASARQVLIEALEVIDAIDNGTENSAKDFADKFLRDEVQVDLPSMYVVLLNEYNKLKQEFKDEGLSEEIKSAEKSADNIERPTEQHPEGKIEAKTETGKERLVLKRETLPSKAVVRHGRKRAKPTQQTLTTAFKSAADKTEGFFRGEKVSPKEAEQIKKIKSILKDQKGEVVLDDLIQVGTNLIRQGHNTFSKFRRQLRRIFADVWDKIKHLARQIYDSAKQVLASEKGEITAFHGSPHGFEKFTTAKIGTGEGVQAFGWGLYFTDKQDIASWYADNLGRQGNIVFDGVVYDRDSFVDKIGEQYGEEYKTTAETIVYDFFSGYLPDQIIENFKTRNPQEVKVVKDIVAGIERQSADFNRWTITPEGGIRTYNKMSKRERMALFDIQGRAGWLRKSVKDPLSKVREDLEQTVRVQKDKIKNGESSDIAESKRWLESAQDAFGVMDKYNLKQEWLEDTRNVYEVTLHKGKTPDQYTWLDWYEAIDDKLADKITNQAIKEKIPQKIIWADSNISENPEDIKGVELYARISGYFQRKEGYQFGDNGQKEASLFLLRAGIDGIRYPTGTLSGKVTQGRESFNYVVFDEDAVTITKHRILSILQSETGTSAAMNDLVELGAELIKRGHNRYLSFRREFKNTLSEVWDKIKHLARQIFDSAKQVLSSERGSIGGKESGPEWARKLIADYQESIKGKPKVTAKPITEKAVENGMRRFEKGGKFDRGKFYKKTGTQYPTSDPADLYPFINWLQTAQDLAKNYPKIARIFEVQIRRLAEANRDSIHDRKLTEPYFTLKKKSRKKVNAVLFEGDANLKEWSDDKLKGFGLNSGEIEAYKAVRQALDEKLNSLIRDLLAMVVGDVGVTDKMIEVVKSTKDKAKLVQKLNKLGVDTKEADRLHFIAEWAQARRGYVPHKWKSKWRVRVDLGDGNIWLLDVPTLQGRTFPTRELRRQAANRAAVREAKKQLGLTQEQIDKLAKQTDENGIPDFYVIRSRQVPVELFQGARMDVMNSIIESGVTQAMNQYRQELSEEQFKLLSDSLETKVKQNIQEMYLAKGWGQHLIGRKGIRGYREDLENVLAEYLNGFNAFIAKGKAARDFGEAMGDIDPTKTPRQWRWAKEYIEDMLGETHEAAWFKKIAGTYFLAADVSAAALNMTQNWTHGVAVLRGIKAKGKVAEKEIYDAMRDIAKEYAHARARGKTLFNESSDWLSEDEIKAIQMAYEDGHLDPQFLGETVGLHENKVWNHYTKKIQLLMFKMFTGAEGWNRTSTLLAAYRRGKRGGLSEGEAFEKAVGAVMTAHFPYGKSNRPQVIRRFGAVGNIAYSYMTYPVSNIVFLKHHMEDIFKGDKAAVKVVGSNLAYTFAFGGLIGLPFSWLAQIVIDIFDDDEDDWEVMMRKHMPKTAGRIAARGIPAALLGSDMSWRVQGTDALGIPIGFQIIEMAKRRAQTAWKLHGQGEDLDALFHVMPDMIRNPYRAIVGLEEGGTGRGKPPIKYTGKEAVSKALGFTPTREAETFKTEEVVRKKQKKRLAKLEDFAEALLIARRKGDIESRKLLKKRIKEYNMRQRKKGTEGVPIPYSEVVKSAKRRLKSRRKGYGKEHPKYLRRFQRETQQNLGLQ